MNDLSGSLQTNDPETSHIFLKKTITVIFLVIILFFAAWIRFDGITEQGATAEKTLDI